MLKLIVVIFLLISLASIAITKILEKNTKSAITFFLVMLMITFLTFTITWVLNQPVFSKNDKEEERYSDDYNTESSESETEDSTIESTMNSITSEENSHVTEEEQKMLIATSQNVLKRYSIKDDMTHSADAWTINKQQYEDSYRWTAVTNSPSHKRLKFIYEWDGNLNNSQIILIYLFVHGDEIVNDLN